jgi:ketosteroid isomerase-like protein
MDNLELVKHLYNSFNNKKIEEIIKILHPKVEWGEPENPYNPAGGRRYGIDGFLEWISIGKQNEEILQLNITKMFSDESTVAVIGNMECLAIPTGKTYKSDFVHIIEIRENKILKFQEFFDTYIAGEAFRK